LALTSPVKNFALIFINLVRKYEYMKKRISITLDNNFEKQLREKWGEEISKKKKKISFSEFLERLIRLGLQSIRDGIYSF
jgi:restriction endonuclease